MPSKAEIRKQINRLRQGLDHEWIRKNSQLIQRRLLQHPGYREAETLGLYLARPDEVDTRHILAQARDDGKEVCVPRYHPETRQYALCRYEPDTALKEGPWRIPEPVRYHPADLDRVDLLLIPAIALDRKGGRLGHGGGYYDRILSGYNGIKGGLIFAIQLVAEVPMEDHDIPVDFIITETDFYETVYYNESSSNRNEPET